MVPRIMVMIVVEVAIMRLLRKVLASSFMPENRTMKFPRFGSAGQYTGGTEYISSADLKAMMKSQ
jgi:hypothetical protein